MGLHPSTLHGPDAVIFPSSSTGNLTFFNPAPHVNPSIAAQATSPLTPASSAETTATQTNSPSSLFNPSKKPTRSTVAHKKPRHAPHPRPSTVVTNVTTIVNPGPDTEPQLKNPPKKKKKQQQKQGKRHHTSRTDRAETPGAIRSPILSPPENNVDDAVLRKKAHNLVEKRYRANLNSRFAALEQAVRSKTATTVVTAASTRNTTTSTSTSTSPTGTTNLIVKSTSDTRTNGPSKKAAILKNALAYIEELRSENRTLRKELALLRRTTTYGTITGIGSSPEYTEEG